MAIGGGGVSALFWVPPVTPGDFAAWLEPGVLDDGGGGGGGGMSIGGTVVGGTPGSVLFIGPASTLAQDNAAFFWDDTNKHFEVKGDIQLKGSASGTVTVAPQAAAGTWTFSLPTNPGTNNFVLQTDGTGITSWVAAGAASMAIGSPVTSGTTGSVLFIGAGPVLAQDNANFFWDDTGFILKLAGELDFQSATALFKVAGTNRLDYGLSVANTFTVNGNVDLTTSSFKYSISTFSALYVVTNASGNNWFEGNAGNTSVTGYQNFGTGDSSLISLTTGFQNTCVGSNSGQHLTSGFNNFVFGSGGLQTSLLDAYNTAIGVNCLNQLGTGGAGAGGNTGNFAAGFAAMNNASQGFNNVAIGFTALSNATATANQNVVIGGGAGSLLGSGGGNVSFNTFIGCNSGANLTGSSNSNTWLGGFAGPSAVINHTIAIGDGTAATVLFDFSLSSFNVWSFSSPQSGQSPTGIRIYNIQDTNSIGLSASIVNYERGVLDWTLTTNVFRLACQVGGTGTARLIAIDGFQKAGAPAAGDLPSTTWSVINDTSGGQTWLVYNNAGTIRKVQLT